MTLDDPTVNSGQKLLKSAKNSQKVAKRQKRSKIPDFGLNCQKNING